ncbi:MAG: TlpA family protein disulfide reductase [Bacteroidia bacterium]
MKLFSQNKYLIIFLLLSFPFSLIAQYATLIRGEMQGLETGKVLVYEQGEGNRKLFAGQAQVTEGKFEVQVRCLYSPTIYLDFEGNRTSQVFFLTDEKELIFHGKLKNPETWKVSKLKEQHEFTEYKKYEEKLNVIRETHAQQVLKAVQTQNDSLKEAAQFEFLQKKATFLAELAEFIRGHSLQNIALFALQRHFVNERDIRQLEELYYFLPKRQNSLAISIERTILQGQATKFGTKLPNFTLTSDTGKNIQLTDFQGKYLLIEFWASWCRPCREELPKLQHFYENHKTTATFPLEILTISTDKDTAAWKNALQELQTTWVNVIDKPDFQASIAKQCKVGVIPSNLLLNEKGEIIGKDLRIEELKEKLKTTK